MSTGDVLREPYETLSGRDWLGFAGIDSAEFPAVSPEEQFAEKKIHAYTLTRVGRENSRVKDLIDLVLLIEHTKLNAARLPKAIRELSASQDARNSATGLMVRTVFRNGGGM